MRTLRQLGNTIDTMPPWLQLALGVFLICFTAASIYGRFDTNVGAKLFSKIPEDEIQTNMPHIFGYTVVPLIVTVGYFILLANQSGE